MNKELPEPSLFVDNKTNEARVRLTLNWRNVSICMIFIYLSAPLIFKKYAWKLLKSSMFMWVWRLLMSVLFHTSWTFGMSNYVNRDDICIYTALHKIVYWRMHDSQHAESRLLYNCGTHLKDHCSMKVHNLGHLHHYGVPGLALMLWGLPWDLNKDWFWSTRDDLSYWSGLLNESDNHIY